ncbi:hypothetical protein IFO70_10500 [Phormidium tenue FACHB-886]|nr:hypothetical protein [Phormidium tenue FACHB-886]
MSDARKIARIKAEQARDRYYSRQIERQETADTADRPTAYRGYDADSGSHITQRTGHNPVPGAISLTNGGLSEGETIAQSGGSNSFTAMPHPRKRRRRRRRIAITETLISVLFVGARDSYAGGAGATGRTLLFWTVDSDRDEVKLNEIELTFFQGQIGGAKGVFDADIYHFYITADERIVQVYVRGMAATGTAGDLAELTTTQQSSNNFVTVHLREGAIAKVELTNFDAAVAYSDYWDAYLPYLWGSSEFNQELLDDRLTIAPAGRFTLEQPPKPEQGRDGFKDLKNFFGAEPPAYTLSDGDPATFALNVDDFGFSEAEKAFATQDGMPFADRLKIEQSDRLSAPFGGFQVNANYVHLRCAAVRGFVE